MLSGKPTNAEIERTIHRTIIEILERDGKTAAPFDGDADVVSTGLRSLDLAALIARLQRAWKVDPFLEAFSITDIRTVGDLCRAYQKVINAA